VFVLNALNADVHRAEGGFVSFAGFGEFGVGVVFAEVGVVPFLPSDHGMVRSGQGFLCPNGGDPFIGGLFVGETELIEIARTHGRKSSPKACPGQFRGGEFNEKLTRGARGGQSFRGLVERTYSFYKARQARGGAVGFCLPGHVLELCFLSTCSRNHIVSIRASQLGRSMASI